MLSEKLCNSCASSHPRQTFRLMCCCSVYNNAKLLVENGQSCSIMTDMKEKIKEFLAAEKPVWLSRKFDTICVKCVLDECVPQKFGVRKDRIDRKKGSDC